MPATPLISVVMPALNAAGMLRTALDSLAGQDVPYEALIVDGGSRDDTVAIAQSFPHVRVVSAPRTSIYEAINRGIAEAAAPAIALLNSDDVLLPHALASWLGALDRNPKADIARGWATFVERRPDGRDVPLANIDARNARDLDLGLLLRGACAVNSLCVRKSLFDRIGTFDPVYRLASDRDWMLRAWLSGAAVVEINQPVYRYLSHAGSHTIDRARRNFALMREECIAIAESYLPDVQHLPPDNDIRSALRRWHAAESAMLALHHVKAAGWRETAATLSRAFRIAPLWPVTLAADTAMRLSDRGKALSRTP
jgi:glycosyltransferase involved in cell wall biosynthesis